MRSAFVLLTAAAISGLVAAPSEARDRYAERKPVVVSPDLSAPWVIQLGSTTKSMQKNVQKKRVARPLPAQQDFGVQVQPPQRVVRRAARPRLFDFLQRDRQREAEVQVQPQRRVARQRQLFGQSDSLQTAAVLAPRKREIQPELDPIYLPQQVDYDGPGKAGDIVINSADKFLYLIQPGGQARRYGVGVGKEGMGWTGTETVTNKKVWPEWRPPAEMIARERANGRILPTMMEGGPANPLGARALYLGDTLYRIHGTNAPWTIGTNVSSGCIRLRNEDVVDLYERVGVGTKVIVM